jgi:3-oxoacyl-[acyl-carrier-protein] synthase II
MFIRAMGNISPQNTFGNNSFLTEPVSFPGNRLSCIEPDYKNWIDLKMIRRMSRIIRMGVTAALACLKDAKTEMPDAIITGTAYGCLEDTGLFLTKMVEQKEEMLTPTAFIQSTHNTVGAQIALLLHCHGYNNTFVHRAHSFESALLDAKMLLDEKEASDVLVGGLDEITPLSHSILERLGIYKKETIPNLGLFTSQTKGTIAGEGAAFFLFSSKPGEDNYARLDGFATIYKPGSLEETEKMIRGFLETQNTKMDEIDLIITGKNGDPAGDQLYDIIGRSVFQQKTSVNYKHLCGEYPTSTAFALWLAANIIKTNCIPSCLEPGLAPEKNIKKILIYNQSGNMHHSLFLITAC